MPSYIKIIHMESIFLIMLGQMLIIDMVKLLSKTTISIPFTPVTGERIILVIV